ncbi:histone acetyltransferase KAT6A [Cocos nucifera]|uniref:Histone acetyltransferase KAT6A n=1 Tax=Cocos nucifera TaxID=13894 RepID=A0A8K0IQM0_COCNU|nr:histone acetyltransferase KAT6A [Cocos nucifera]
MVAASRRVKLDLCVEPSGEMVDSSLHDEVGGELDKDHQAGVPTSPSPSGQKQENPLLLLGQYSDDELDEEASKQPKHAVEESSSVNMDGQVQESADAGGNTGNNNEKATTSGDVKEDSDQLDTLKNVDGHDANESNNTMVATQYCESDSTTKTVPDTSGMQIIGDMTGGWKVVMHEQSNQCYYWNTVTGETSWVIPHELVIAGTSSKENVSSTIDEKVDYSVPAHTHSDSQLASYSNVLVADGHGGGDSISRSMETYGSVEMGVNGEIVHAAYDVNHGLAHYNTPLVGISCEESSALSAFGSLQQSTLLLSEHMTNSGEECPLSSEDKLLTRPTGCYETVDVHSLRLVKYGENLLQRLKALDGSQICLGGLQWTAKEIEIRISDCKALSSYGSSLLPFWWHTETQLKQLESAIVKGESSCLVQSKHDSKVETEQNPSWKEECSVLHRIETGSDLVERNSTSGDAENNCSSLSNDVVKVQNEASNCMPETENVRIIGISSGSVTHSMGSEKAAEILEPKGDLHAEDVDMDVEMEVDEETVAGQTVAEALSSAECPAPTEQIIQSNSSALECPSVPLDDSSIPPPPDEEWIPPPPPDSEPVPPPPPEEPPAPAPCPPTYDNTIPPYQDQYNLAYTLPTYEYYAPVASEVTNANYYAQADGSHVAQPQPPSYYEPAAIASAFPEVAADVNPAEPIAYYGLSSGAVPHAPVVSNTGSGFYVESAPVSYHSAVTAADYTRSVGSVVDSERTSLPQVKPASDMCAVTSETETASVQADSIASTVQAAGTALGNGSATAAPSSVSQKNQSKVARSKKRTVAVAPTLRSNKKVSSLVDKWKAAKEELHGDEDEEPENAYEILEKKRQKEIEVWRTRQIASGEAQENANFVPLGGDWRERVKRRRAEAKAEAGEAPREQGVENEKKQPDLVQLSKDLPSGWQAYWDESTKEVYYGNNITSETTWSRPTR